MSSAMGSCSEDPGTAVSRRAWRQGLGAGVLISHGGQFCAIPYRQGFS